MEAVQRKSILGTILFLTALVAISAYFLSQYFASIDEENFLPFGASFAIFVYLLTLIDIRIGIGILILSVGLSPEVTIGGIPNLRLEDFLVPVLIFAWATRIVQGRERLEPSPVMTAFFLYLVACGISWIFSVTAQEFLPPEIRRLTSEPTPVYRLLVAGKFLEYLLIFIVILNNVRTLEDIKAFIVFTVIVSAVSSLYSFSLAMPKSSGEDVGKIMGPFGESANIFGGYISMNMGILLGLYAFLKTTTQRFWVSMLLLFSFYVLIFTYSRTSWSALFVGLLIFSFLKNKHLLVALFVLAIIFLLIAPQAILERAVSVFTIGVESGPPAWRARVSSWTDYFDLILERPLFGYGIGTVKLGDVDNEYMRVLVDVGFVGFAAFVFFLFKVTKLSNNAFEKMKQTTSTDLILIKAYTAGFFMSMIMVIVHCFGATTLTSIRTTTTFMILAALMNAIHNHIDEWIVPKEEKQRDQVVNPNL